MKTRQNNDLIDRRGVVYIENELSFRDQSDYVRSMIKTKQDNDMSNHTSAIYTEKETELS